MQMVQNKDSSETAVMQKLEQAEKKVRNFRDKLGIKDENAGEKIKDMADKAGVIGSLGALISGFYLWSRTDSLLDFFIGLMIAALGVFASCVLVSFLYSYGDMITLSVEQTKILKRLEAKKAEEAAKMAADMKQQTVPVAEPEPPVAPAAQGLREGNYDEEFGDALWDSLNPGFKRPEKPSEAIAVDRVGRSAHFAKRSEFGVVCPICGKQQIPDHINDTCYRCSCQFIFDDDGDGRRQSA